MPQPAFFGRQAELVVLDGHLRQVASSGAGCLLALRGRRQVGKSRLIEHFAERSGLPYGVVAGMQGAPVQVQMRRAVETLRSSTRPLPNLEVATAVVPTDWYDLLARLRLALGEGPSLFVIDELPWAVQASPGLDGLLQSLWDQELSRRPVLCVLVGSDEAMMQRLVEHDRPLFGRLDDSMVVQPFNPAETAQALGGSRDAMEVFDAQLVTGGFPELVAHARRFPAIRQLVEDAVSRPHTLLADVAQITLAGELADAGTARLVLESIGSDEIGEVTFSRIAALLGGGTAARTAVTRAMGSLLAKRIVAVDLPAGDRGGRLKRYRVADPYLRFWFRFLGPQLRNIEVGRPDLAVAAFRSGWSTWRGKAIEPLVREGLLRLAPRLDQPLALTEAVGGWWNRSSSHEVDLVASSGRGVPIAVGSIKWRERAVFTNRDLHELAGARALVPGAAGAALLAVAPRGVGAGVGVDAVLDAEAVLDGWR